MSETPPTPPPLPPPARGPAAPPGAAGPVAAAYPPGRQSFGEQAARFSLYAPLLIIVLGCLSSRGDESGVGMAFAWINLGLMVAGFVLGLVALVSMRVYGRKGILVRAVVGVLVNGLFLASAVSILMPAMAAKRVRDQVAGRWQVESEAGKAVTTGGTDIDLSADGTFRLTRRDGAGGVASVSGNWGITRNRVLGLKVLNVEAGDPSTAGQSVALGTVKSVDRDRLVLTHNNGEDVLRRSP